MANHQPMNLLDLPVDILALILAPIVAITCEIELCPCPDHGLLDARLQDVASVLLIHPHIHSIACPMFYNINTFKLSITSGEHGRIQSKSLQTFQRSQARDDVLEKPLNDGLTLSASTAAEQRREMGKLLIFVTQSARRRIRKLKVDVGRRRGWLDEVITPALSDMILAGNLASLRITLLYSTHEGSLKYRSGVPSYPTAEMSNDALIFTKPPLVGLLKVLADPDLDAAELLVSIGHPPVFCKYHIGKNDGSALAEGSSNRPCGLYASIDWLSIIRDIVDPGSVGPAAPWANGTPRRRRLAA